MLSLCAGVALAVTIGGAEAQDKMPFGGPDSVAYSQELWKVLEKAGLVGASAKPDKPYAGTEPHGFVLETIESKATVKGHAGKVIVKRNYGPAGISVDAVKSDRAKHLKAITVMFQREEGYDPDNQNWFWVKYKPDGSLDINPKGMKLAGRVAKGMDQGCIACHKGAGGGDYLFRNDN